VVRLLLQAGVQPRRIAQQERRAHAGLQQQAHHAGADPTRRGRDYDLHLDLLGLLRSTYRTAQVPANRRQRSDLAVAIGARLRELRDRRGLSLGVLAARSGLGKGTLSELETGRRNPTLETLFAVTTALGVPLSAALPAGETHTPDRPPIVVGDAIEAVLVDRFVDVLATTELYRVTIAAGRRQRSAPHAPGVTEHWIVYAGVLQLGPDDAQTKLAAGESRSFTADVPHRYRAHQGADVKATLVVRYAASADAAVPAR
jgi:transcriptional regulator with XRE-family HTH domain